MYYVDVGDYISIKAYLREREKIRRHKIKTQLNDEKRRNRNKL